MAVRFGVLLLVLIGLTLAAGQSPASRVVSFASGAKAGTGDVRIERPDAATRVTTLILSKLTPRARYVAHYHALPANHVGDPCAADGPVTLTFPPFSADEDGRATVTVRASEATFANGAGAYVDVHLAGAASSALLCAALVEGASHDHGGAAVPASADVVIGDNFFRPSSLSVPLGTTVTWRYDGAGAHDVVALDGAFQSAELRGGDAFRHTFDRAGTSTYYCSYHEGMTATITVTDRP